MSEFKPLATYGATRVLAAVRRGSSSPVVTETDGGRFLVKLRGAAQGLRPLVAEIVVGELAEALGLPVPERAIITLGEGTPSDDRNDELADLLRSSIGDNVGLRLLDGATDLRPADAERLPVEFALRVLWLDRLVHNVDRTSRNPNILSWHGQPWLIDHGAALSFHYDWGSVTEDSPRQVDDAWLADHLFAARLHELRTVDAALTSALDRATLTSAVDRVPSAFLCAVSPGEDPRRVRAQYVAYLWKRLKPPRPFVP